MRRFILAAAVCTGVPLCASAGDTDPPAGPVAGTMKTLREVEPRTVVNAVNTPGTITSSFVISAPGSYYLDANLVGETDMNGIEITSGDVTLDLMGFSVIAGVGSRDGITTGKALPHNVRIGNGTIAGWRFGVRLNGSFNRIERVTSRGNSIDGIVGSGLLVTDSISTSNGDDGFDMSSDSAVTRCSAEDNAGHGFNITGSSCVLAGCNASGNTGDGFLTGVGGTLTGCTATLNTGDGFEMGDGAAATGCSARQSGANGFLAGAGCTLDGCTSSNNGLAGFLATAGGATISGCAALGNTSGTGFALGSDCSITDSVAQGGSIGISTFARATVRSCTTSGNSLTGFMTGNASTVRGCASSLNGGHGFFVAMDSVVSGCSATGNTLHGFAVDEGNVITECTASKNTQHGISVTGGRNRIAHNVCDLNTGDGIHVTGYAGTIDSNLVTANATGIWVQSCKLQSVTRNVAASNTTNYTIGAGACSPGDFNAPAPFGSPTSTTNPWANMDL